MPRPIMLSIAGDSGSGKTTVTRGVVRVLGEDQVTHLSTDDYHRYDRRQRGERGITASSWPRDFSSTTHVSYARCSTSVST